MASSQNNHAVFSSTAGKVITCKAAVAWGPKQPLVVQDIQVDPPKAMEVRIKITHASLCHSDITLWSMTDSTVYPGILGHEGSVYPRILGHEGSGIVESVGKGVTDLQPGDHVIPLYLGECGSCNYCKSPKTILCENYGFNLLDSVMKSDSKTRFSVNGKPIYHFMHTSTFTEYTVVESANVVKIGPEIPLPIACLLGCGLTTGIGAAWNCADVQPGSTVAVYGLGTVGLAVVEGARIRGASTIIGIDINPKKAAKAKAIGVTHFLNPKEHEKPIDEVIKEMTGGGVDYCFECIGNVDVMSQALSSTHEGWGLTMMMGFDPSLRPVQVPQMDLFYGKRVASCMFGGFKGKSKLPHLVEMCVRKEVNAYEFITHELPFSEINKTFDLMLKGDCLRCMMSL